MVFPVGVGLSGEEQGLPSHNGGVHDKFGDGEPSSARYFSALSYPIPGDVLDEDIEDLWATYHTSCSGFTETQDPKMKESYYIEWLEKLVRNLQRKVKSCQKEISEFKDGGGDNDVVAADQDDQGDANKDGGESTNLFFWPHVQTTCRFVVFPDQHIGKGAYGLVYKGKDREENEFVAVKCLPRGAFLARPWVRREILNQSMMAHPHIVHIKGVFLTRNFLCMAMEYCEGGSLFELIKAKGCLREDWSRWYFQQLILALDFCHKKGVSVRDIKLEHLLLDEEKKALKLCGFGWSKHAHESAPHTKAGTPRYSPPELVLRSPAEKEAYDAEKLDIWCCGFCLYTMLYAEYPTFTEVDREQLQREGVVQSFRTTIPTHQKRRCVEHKISEDLIDLLGRLLEPDYKTRIDIQGIFEHPWFQDNISMGSRDLNKIIKMNEKEIRLGLKQQSREEIEELILRAQTPGPKRSEV